MTSRALSTDWISLTVRVNSDLSGEAGALAALSDEGVSWAKTDAKWELNRLAISRGFSAEDRNGVRLPGSVDALTIILASRLDQEMHAIWNSASV